MKKILIFSVAYHPFVGGAEVAVKEITDRLVGDASFDMITLNLDERQKKEEQIGNVHVYRIGDGRKISKLLFPYYASKKAAELHRQKNYSAIWSIMASFSGFAALIFKYRHPEVPFILTLQEGDPLDGIKSKVRFVYPLFKRIFTKADTIQPISNYLADFARSMGTKAPITVIPNGVDVALFSQEIPEEEKNELMQALNKQPHDIFIITTSRLVIKNGVGDIISALTYLPQNIKLLIVGTGPLLEELRQLTRTNGVGNRVMFLGFVDYKTIPLYLAVSDIFIRPSLSEGMGNSFIEAMAARVPVIATPVGGIPDFLKNHETGVFCNPQDPRDIAEKVNLLLNDGYLTNKIVAQAFTLVSQKYDWNSIAKTMAEKVFAVDFLNK